MKKYEKYIKCSIDWISDIPINWRTLKIGWSFLNIGSGTTPKSNNSEYYENGQINWLNTGDLNDSYITETAKKITELAVMNHSTLKEYPVDSIVIALYGATIGKLGHLKTPTTTNQACCVISESKDIIQRFLFYYFHAAREFIISKSYGGGQPNISQDLIRQLYIPTPSLSEQTAIASFLDHKTTQIDTLIEKKEKLIEKLKLQRQAIINEVVTKGLNPDAPMKDSGIEWLGEIPEHWDVVKLKMITDLITDGAHISPDTSKEDYPFVSTVDLNQGKIDWDNCLKTSTNNYNYLVQTGCKPGVGDVLYSKDGTIGKTTVVRGRREFVVASSLIISRPSPDKVIPDYLEYLLRSNIVTFQVDSLLSGVALRRVSLQKFSNLIVSLPSIGEQIAFIEKIGSAQDKYLVTLKKIETSIDKLKRYRQSLISEAVTGKIDVRDWENV